MSYAAYLTTPERLEPALQTYLTTPATLDETADRHGIARGTLTTSLPRYARHTGRADDYRAAVRRKVRAGADRRATARLTTADLQPMLNAYLYGPSTIAELAVQYGFGAASDIHNRLRALAYRRGWKAEWDAAVRRNRVRAAVARPRPERPTRIYAGDGPPLDYDGRYRALMTALAAGPQTVVAARQAAQSLMTCEAVRYRLNVLVTRGLAVTWQPPGRPQVWALAPCEETSGG